jgi:ABC-type transport system involved in multi-copper enzyme maturation permease subunit
MLAAAKKIYGSIAPALIFEFIYRQNHAYVSYSISALTICACFLFGQWPPEAEAAGYSYGNSFFTVIMICMILVSTIVSTAHASILIAGEKEKKTLTLLRMSGLSPLEIILSKIAVNLCFIALLLLPFAPLILACPLLGGITYGIIFRGLLVLSAAVIFFACSGIFISVLFKKNYTCISFAAAFLLFIHFGFFIIDDLIYDKYGSSYLFRRSASKLFSAFSPLEMWKNYFDSMNSEIYYNFKPYSHNLILQLSYAESAVVYLTAAVLTTIVTVKFFERYLKWRED